MARFADVLESHPAPKALGDITLRYEPSMLIGETRKSKATWRSTAVWMAGVGLLLFSAGGLVLQWDASLIAFFLVAGGMSIAAAVLLERFERRQRRFVANFASITLRLDFTSPIAGHARTLLVPFDAVRDVALFRQADDASCLCVDFERDRALLREVLVAHIPDAQLPEAERLERVLHGAFGLGKPPGPGQNDSTLDLETSSFE